MAKDILSCFGLLFLTIVVLVGVAGIIFVYGETGAVQIPRGIIQTPASFFKSDEIVINGGEADIKESRGGKAEWVNPLEPGSAPTQIPFSTPTAWPADLPLPPPEEAAWPQSTATPWPTVEPGIYQTEAVLRLKRYAVALERWLEANKALAEAPEMRSDPVWRAQMEQHLADVAASGHALAVIGIPPQPYAVMDEYLVQVGDESAALQQNYLQALETGDPQTFQAAGDNFTRIKEYLSKAVAEMIAAGWSLE